MLAFVVVDGRCKAWSPRGAGSRRRSCWPSLLLADTIKRLDCDEGKVLTLLTKYVLFVVTERGVSLVRLSGYIRDTCGNVVESQSDRQSSDSVPSSLPAVSGQSNMTGGPFS